MSMTTSVKRLRLTTSQSNNKQSTCSDHLVKMPRANTPGTRRPTWSAEGLDAAQLFRDIYFGKYPDGTKVSEVYEDEERPYRRYNRDGFYRQYKKFLEKVETYKTFGTGLSETFRHKVKLNKPPGPEEKSTKKTTKKTTTILLWQVKKTI
jgi:hypothetical protein